MSSSPSEGQRVQRTASPPSGDLPQAPISPARDANPRLGDRTPTLAIRDALERARDAGRRRQKVIQVPAVVFGLSLFIVALAFGFVPTLANLPWARGSMVSISYTLGLLSLLLALIPTQRRVVRAGVVLYSLFMLYTAGGVGAGSVVPTALALATDTHEPCSGDGAASSSACTLALVRLVRSCVIVAVHVCGIVLLLGSLCRARMQARAQLDLVWRVFAVTQIVMGLARLSFDIPAALGYHPPRAAPFASASLLLLTGAAAATGRLREVTQAWLASNGEGIRSASMLSVLLSGRSAEEALLLAEGLLRSVSADKVDAAGLRGDRSEQECFALSEPASFGSVDAFVCHAHGDSAEERAEQLRLWAADFSREHGRAPRLWMDAYCLEARSIEPSLECLPVFLASCDRLLVLHGPALPQRLWCVTELFFHLSIGAQRASKTDVLRLPSATANNLLPAGLLVAQDFDGRRAQCMYSHDRDLLLTILEAYPGGIPAFNTAVSRMLVMGSEGGGSRGPDEQRGHHGAIVVPVGPTF